MGEALAVVEKAPEEVDRIEVRVDAIRRGELGPLLACRRPLILTARHREQGGEMLGGEAERLGLIERFLRDSPHWVDVEATVPATRLRRWLESGRVVLSHHDFSGMPADLPGLIDRIQGIGRGHAIVKIVPTAGSLDDCQAVRDCLMRDRTGRLALFAMGDAGFATRVLGAVWGSWLTYAALDPRARSAPGQPSVEELLSGFRWRSLTSATRLYGVVGREVEHSLSPALHNLAFAAVGARAVYLPFRAQSFDEFTRWGDALRVRGVSVTAPFKGDAFEAAVRRGRVARRVGAANTLLRTEQGWAARNTDVEGFRRAALERRPPRSAVVLGTGGASRAVVLALSSSVGSVWVVGRSSRPEGWLERFGVRYLHRRRLETDGLAADLWVNATSAIESPVPASLIRGRRAMDLGYRQEETPFLREAARAGLTTENGLRMLYYQGLEQQRLFRGRRLEPRIERRLWHGLRRQAAAGPRGPGESR